MKTSAAPAHTIALATISRVPGTLSIVQVLSTVTVTNLESITCAFHVPAVLHSWVDFLDVANGFTDVWQANKVVPRYFQNLSTPPEKYRFRKGFESVVLELYEPYVQPRE